MNSYRTTQPQLVQHWIVLTTISSVASMIIWFAMEDIENETERRKYEIPALILLIPLISTIFGSLISRVFRQDFFY